MKHPYADILIAVAEGKEIQDRTETGYMTVDASHVLRVVGNGGGQYLRVKPATIRINGVACEAPSKEGSYDITICGSQFWFTSLEARDAAYTALIKPFGEKA